jgi:hypothetical protein
MSVDEINVLVLRCYMAIRLDGGEYAELTISHPTSGDREWLIGYRNSGDWKNNFSAPTLAEALKGWLEEYEHHYDDGPYKQPKHVGELARLHNPYYRLVP